MIKLPANTKVWFSPGTCIIDGMTDEDGDNKYVEVDGCLPQLEDINPIDQYGHDGTQAGYDCYHMASNVPITLDRIIGVRDQLAAMGDHTTADYKDGYLYDSADESFTGWEGLDDELQAEISSHYATSTDMFDDCDTYIFYAPKDLREQWIDCLDSAIVALSEFIETEVD